MPLVTVYILSYNQERFIKQRIESVLQQSFTDFQVVIFDDCSADYSKDIIETYRGNNKLAQIVYNEMNSGSGYKQWHKAIESCTTKYLWIAEGDDYAAPDFLQHCVNVMESDASLCLVETNAAFVYENGSGNYETTGFMKNESFPERLWEDDYAMKGLDIFSKALCFGNCIPNASSVLFRTDIVRELHFALSKYRYCGDWALYILLSQAYSFGYINKVLSYYRQHDDSAFKTGKRNGQKQKEFFTIIAANTSLLKDMKRYPSNYLKTVSRYVSVFDTNSLAKLKLLRFYMKQNPRIAVAGLLYNLSSRMKKPSKLK